MSSAGATVDPTAFGLPSRAELQRHRIWDSYYFPRIRVAAGALAEDIAADLRVLEPWAIERLCAYFHVGLGTLGPAGRPSPAEDPARIRGLLGRWPDRLLGVVYLNANDVAGSLRALDAWVKDGPAVGVYFKSSPPGCLACTTPTSIRSSSAAASWGR